MIQEFSPRDEIIHSLRGWWILAVFMILGGLAGYIVHRVEPPVYQAKAILYSYIDYQEITDVRLMEFDEDVTVNTIQSVMLSNQVVGQVLEKAGNAGIPIDYVAFMDNMSIYRSLTNFELFYRDRDPKIAQAVVNIWTLTGYSDFLLAQSNGSVPRYITVEIQYLAELPQSPSYSQTNSYVISGSILGFVAGLVVTATPLNRRKNKRPSDIRNKKAG
jgi:hypothetical protein